MSSLSEFFDKLLKRNDLAKIGTIILIGALVLLFLKLLIPCYIALGVVLGIDLYLVKNKKQTITQWFRPKFPKVIDTIIAIGLVVAFILFGGPVAGIYFLMGTINGHLNGDW
jgi:hypothetical protein